MPRSSRWLSRMATAWLGEAAVLLRCKRRRIMRVRWIMGWMGEHRWAMDEDLLDPEHDAECRDRSRPRPDARNHRSSQLRSVARSGMRECGCGVRTAEACNARMTQCYPVGTQACSIATRLLSERLYLDRCCGYGRSCQQLIARNS